eukprot:2394046-Rhodomonas_salina.1
MPETCLRTAALSDEQFVPLLDGIVPRGALVGNTDGKSASSDLRVLSLGQDERGAHLRVRRRSG